MQVVNGKPSLLVSVAVITWNRFDFTRRTLASLGQTLTGSNEITVIDNRSEARMREWLQAWVATGPNRKAILLERNIGPGLACQMAWEVASGKYLMRSDNDVQYLPGWLDAALSAFSRLPERTLLSLFAPPPAAKTEPVDDELVCASYVGGGSFLMHRSLWNVGVRYTQETDFDKQDQEFARAVRRQDGHILAYRHCPFIVHLGASQDTANWDARICTE
jgi:glycosyltransferase involved in cell wall biosynthesis